MHSSPEKPSHYCSQNYLSWIQQNSNNSSSLGFWWCRTAAFTDSQMLLMLQHTFRWLNNKKKLLHRTGRHFTVNPVSWNQIWVPGSWWVEWNTWTGAPVSWKRPDESGPWWVKMEAWIGVKMVLKWRRELGSWWVKTECGKHHLLRQMQNSHGFWM